MRMLRRPVKEVNAEFAAEEKYLDSIQRIVRESCAAAGMSRRDTQAVLLAVEEGATNIIRHAYLYEKGVIRLRIVIYRKIVVFSLIDYGRSYRPGSVGRIDLERLVESGRKGGLGFYMIQKIMDSVEYISSAGRNELRMIKRTRPVKGEVVPFLRRMFTLRVKFSIWTFLVVAVIVAGTYYLMDRQTSRQLVSRLDATVQSLTKTIANQAAGYTLNSRSDVEFDELVVSYCRANPELQLLILTDSLGTIIAHSDDIRNIRKSYTIPSHVSADSLGFPQRFEESNQPLSYFMTPMSSGDQYLGMVHAVYSLAQVNAQLAEARRRIAVFTGILLLVGVVGIFLLSNYFVRPIVKITRRVRRFTSGDLDTELPLEGAEEFFEIARALNEMMARLSQDRKNVVEREKMAKEIEVASQIQQTLLPKKLPEVAGLEVDAFYQAASAVGGDLYDMFAVGSDRYCLVVADVSGKGVPASLVMSMLRTVIRIHAGEAVSAKDVLVKVHGYLRENIPPGVFITVLLAIYDADGQLLRLVSAGHNPMFHFHAASDSIRKINPAGMPLGVPVTLGRSFSERLEEVEIALDRGDVFVMFTDGVTEAANREGQRYGITRLGQFLHEQLTTDGPEPVASVISSLVRQLEDFAGYAKPSDDITLLAARLVGRDEGHGSSNSKAVPASQSGGDSETSGGTTDDIPLSHA